MSVGTRHYGAKWWKFDFHTHTPKSDDYGKGVDQEILKKKTTREWLLDFMREEIDCVAVTDHNCGDWIDCLKSELSLLDSEKPTGYRPITLFPGVEISVHGGVHILALFDPSVTGNKIVSLLSKCEFQGDHGKTEDCTRKSCAEVIEAIHLEGGIPILAHADEDSGLFKVQNGITLKQSLQSEGLLAMELISPNYSLPTIYSDLGLRLSSVLGSDSHHPAHIGKRYTWVKMESPSIAALRLALHDGEDGVKRNDGILFNPNEPGTRFYLRNMTITRGQKIGNSKDFTLELSPWLTTLIGGRGSGKSSILDFMRIVLARTDDMPKSVQDEFDKFNRIPANRKDLGMLRKETTIRLELVKDGRDIALIWKSDNSWSQEERDAKGNWISTTEVGDVQKRFPIRIFSQKQLYEMTTQPDVLLNLIDEQWDKRSWEESQKSYAEKWLQTRRELRQTLKEIEGITNTKAELEDVKAKIRIFEESGHKDVLNNYQSIQNTRLMLDKKGKQIVAAVASVAELKSRLPDIKLEPDLATAIGDESSKVLIALLNDYEVIRNKFSTIESELNALSAIWVSSSDNLPWNTTADEVVKRYEDLKAQLISAGQNDIAGYSALLDQRAALEAKVQSLTDSESKLKQLRDEETNLLQQLETHERQLRNERVKVINNWKQPKQGEYIRMSLIEMGNRETAEEQLRQLIRKPGGEFAGDIYISSDNGTATGFLADLCENASAGSCWDKLKAIRKTLCEATSTSPKNLDKRFARHLEQLRINTPEDIDRIAIWTPEDKLRLELVKQDGKVEDIETGSAGQRTAGLLGIILSLNDSPIIIDQPEDDLETRLISSLVVSALRQLKQEQQVIVVTHNPNIPVNGAAEQIVELRFVNGQIWTGAMGALQRHEIRRAVCEVMEGGKESLDKRYYRISKALA